VVRLEAPRRGDSEWLWPGDADLSDLSRALWQHGIAHRIYERAGEQALQLQDPRREPELLAILDALQRDELRLRPPERAVPAATGAPSWHRAPLTLLLLAASVVGAVLAAVDYRGVLFSALTFTRAEVVAGRVVLDSLAQTLARGELWRLVTPIFLHFGLLHLAFNGLWLWEFGRRIEMRQGAGRLLLIVLVTGLLGNLAQYLVVPGALFGGMSGVIYGLLGYCWLWGRLRPAEDFQLPAGIMVVLLVWLLIAASGVIEAVGLGAIANAAHVGGLVSGLGLAAVLARVATRRG
jgi:GlpG protein